MTRVIDPKLEIPSEEGEGMTIRELIQRADIPRELVPVFEKLRIEAFEIAQRVYADRTIGYNVDHPCYEEQVYGPVSLASEIYKRARRLAALTSPVRNEKLRPSDLNRMLDVCIDTINYLTWFYSLTVIASGYSGHLDSDDSPDYIGSKHGA